MPLLKRPEYPPSPAEVAEMLKRWLVAYGFKLQEATDRPGVYEPGYWTKPIGYRQMLVRYRGDGLRETVERELMKVAEVLDRLGVSWEWQVPDGRFAALSVYADEARLWSELSLHQPTE